MLTDMPGFIVRNNLVNNYDELQCKGDVGQLRDKEEYNEDII